MAGSWGFCAEGLIPAFDIPSGLNLPVGFSLQYVPSFNKNSTVIDTNEGASIYYASFIGSLYFPFIIDLNPRLRTSFVQLQLGAGWEDITRAVAAYPGMIINGDTVKNGSSTVGELENGQVVSSRILPHVRVDYINHESAKFSLFTQYDHRLMVGGWIEFFSGFRLEMEYSTTLGTAQSVGTTVVFPHQPEDKDIIMRNIVHSVPLHSDYSGYSMNLIRTFFILLACVSCVSIAAAQATAQDSSQGKPTDQFANTAQTLSLAQAQNYNNYLDRVLTAIHTLDPTMKAELPEWVVNDRELKRRIIALLQKDPQFRAQVSELSDVIVTQNPRTQELLRLTVAMVLNSRDEIEAKLGTTIYDKLRDGNYDKIMKTNPVFEQRSYGAFFSFYRADIALQKSGFAFEWMNGKEEIGYPFWLNGTMTLGGAFIRDNFTLHLGVDIVPSDYGVSNAPIAGLFSIPERKLEGTTGTT